jgi:hypothetical protein
MKPNYKYWKTHEEMATAFDQRPDISQLIPEPLFVRQ